MKLMFMVCMLLFSVLDGAAQDFVPQIPASQPESVCDYQKRDDRCLPAPKNGSGYFKAIISAGLEEMLEDTQGNILKTNSYKLWPYYVIGFTGGVQEGWGVGIEGRYADIRAGDNPSVTHGDLMGHFYRMKLDWSYEVIPTAKVRISLSGTGIERRTTLYASATQEGPLFQKTYHGGMSVGGEVDLRRVIDPVVLRISVDFYPVLYHWDSLNADGRNVGANNSQTDYKMVVGYRHRNSLAVLLSFEPEVVRSEYRSGENSPVLTRSFNGGGVSVEFSF